MKMNMNRIRTSSRTMLWLMVASVATAIGCTTAFAQVHAVSVYGDDEHHALIIPSYHFGVTRSLVPAPSVLEGIDELLFETEEPPTGERLKLETLGSVGMETFDAAQREEIRRRVHCAGVIKNEREIPILFASDFANLTCEHRELVSKEFEKKIHYHIEFTMRNYAKERNVSIGGLENAGELQAKSNSVPRTFFIEVIKARLSTALNPEVYLAEQDAFQKGDFDTIFRLASEASGVNNAPNPFVDNMLIDRNKRFAERLASRLKRENVVFVVGAAHLGGEQGLPRLLSDLGLRVSTVELSPISLEELARFALSNIAYSPPNCASSAPSGECAPATIQCACSPVGSSRPSRRRRTSFGKGCCHSAGHPLAPPPLFRSASPHNANFCNDFATHGDTQPNADPNVMLTNPPNVRLTDDARAVLDRIPDFGPFDSTKADFLFPCWTFVLNVTWHDSDGRPQRLGEHLANTRSPIGDLLRYRNAFLLKTSRRTIAVCPPPDFDTGKRYVIDHVYHLLLWEADAAVDGVGSAR